MKSAPPESQASSMHTYTTTVTVSRYDIPRYIVKYNSILMLCSRVLHCSMTLYSRDPWWAVKELQCQINYSKYLRKKKLLIVI